MIFQLRDAARLDLAQIWLTTAERWEVDQADTYIRTIENLLKLICDFPESQPAFPSHETVF